MEEENYCSVEFLDVTQAFDKVLHKDKLPRSEGWESMLEGGDSHIDIRFALTFLSYQCRHMLVSPEV